MYQVEFSKLAERKFRKLDKLVKKQIINKLSKIEKSDAPRRFLEPLTGVTACKLRVGDYRLIVDLDAKNKVIYVLTMEHRGEIYKELERT